MDNLNIAVLAAEEDLQTTMENHARWRRGEPVDEPIVPWHPGTSKGIDQAGLTGQIIDLSKLDPRVRFVVVWIDHVATPPNILTHEG